MRNDILVEYIREVTNELRLKRPRPVKPSFIDKVRSFFKRTPADLQKLDSELQSWFEELSLAGFDMSYDKKREAQRLAQKVYGELLSGNEDSDIAVKKTIRILNRKYAQDFQ